LYRRDLSSLFQIVPAPDSFGKDYGPDLAVWLVPRRLDPFRFDPLRPARNPDGRAFDFGRGSASGADLWMLSVRIRSGSSKKSLSARSFAA
jgi:hypothetical protein